MVEFALNLEEALRKEADRATLVGRIEWPSEIPGPAAPMRDLAARTPI